MLPVHAFALALRLGGGCAIVVALVVFSRQCGGPTNQPASRGSLELHTD